MRKVAGAWRFDEAVAQRFDQEARAHIPNYELVVRKCVDIATALYPDKAAARILDVGCATGYTLEQLLCVGFTHVYGVDNSQAMLDHSKVTERLVLSDTVPAEYGPYDLVLANWTLHFIDAREEYLASIFDSLNKGGTLVITEKMEMSPLVYGQYHHFKRAQGVSQDEVVRKEAAIQGVLTTRPLVWYLETLQKLGFKQTTVLDASYGFVTLVASK